MHSSSDILVAQLQHRAVS